MDENEKILGSIKKYIVFYQIIRTQLRNFFLDNNSPRHLMYRLEKNVEQRERDISINRDITLIKFDKVHF